MSPIRKEDSVLMHMFSENQEPNMMLFDERYAQSVVDQSFEFFDALDSSLCDLSTHLPKEGVPALLTNRNTRGGR